MSVLIHRVKAGLSLEPDEYAALERFIAIEMVKRDQFENRLLGAAVISLLITVILIMIL